MLNQNTMKKSLYPFTIEWTINAPKHPVTMEVLQQHLDKLEVQGTIKGIQVDATLNPSATPLADDQYIITNTSALHANFGTINKDEHGNSLTLDNNDIVYYDGTASEFRIAYDISASGGHPCVWNVATTSMIRWSGTAWVNLVNIPQCTGIFNNTTDWTGASAPYTITITAATHNLGGNKNHTVNVYEDGSGTDNNEVDCGINILDNGDVVISSYIKFAGNYIIR